MKQEELTVNPQEFGLETEQVLSIEQAFLPKIQEREALSTIYQQLITSEITPELCKEAKALRLKLLKVRTGISDIHKTQKAFFLSAGRFVDAWKNKETIPVEQMEETLYDIELYYVKIENERLKRESEQNKKVLAEELAKAEAERKVLEEKAQKELEDREKELQAARDKAEKLEAEKLEEELEKERIEAEKRAENMRLQEEAVELEKAPRKVKLTNWVLSFNIQEFSEQDDEVAANIREKFNGFKVWAKKEIDNIK